MKIIEIHGSNGDSVIEIDGSIRDLRKHIPAEKAVIITDSNVRRFYQKDFPSYDVIEIGVGEKIKNLETVEIIYRRLAELEIDRSAFVIGIGGGIVCDVTGFVASTYLRGLRFGFVSSTLLSQVDASVGGKNGINYGGYKNMVGVFNQPDFVICDLGLLSTLPKREISCGFAEIVKHAAIADADLFSYLEKHHEKALNLDTEVIEKLVYDSIVIKSSIVNKDEKEKGERKKLNFGHTFGHAIETTTGVSHGEAVSAGMILVSALSAKEGHLSVEDGKRINELLAKLKLPTRFNVDRERMLDALKRDKKRKQDTIDLVLLSGIGNAVVKEKTIKELEILISDLCR